jgi:hypothetical protein
LNAFALPEFGQTMYLNSRVLFCGGLGAFENRQGLRRNIDRGPNIFDIALLIALQAAAVEVRQCRRRSDLGSRTHLMNINDQHCDVVFLPRLGSST